MVNAMNQQEKIQLQATEEKLSDLIILASRKEITLVKSENAEIDLTDINEVLDWLKTFVIYNNFDLESTQRERDIALRLLKESNHD